MTDWPVWVLALIDVLAVHRLTRLVTDDILTIPFRWLIIRSAYRRNGGEDVGADPDGFVDAAMVEEPADVPMTAVLVRCRWCASMWAAAGVVLLHQTVPRAWLPIAAVLALSSAATLLARAED